MGINWLTKQISFRAVNLLILIVYITLYFFVKVKNMCNVVYRRMNFDRYPAHVRRLELFAWKPLIIQVFIIINHHYRHENTICIGYPLFTALIQYWTVSRYQTTFDNMAIPVFLLARYSSLCQLIINVDPRFVIRSRNNTRFLFVQYRGRGSIFEYDISATSDKENHTR